MAPALQLAGQFDVQDHRLDSKDGADFVALSRDYHTYALEGFVPAEAEAEVSLDKTATIELTFRIETKAEIVVTSQAPAIDTTSTTTGLFIAIAFFSVSSRSAAFSTRMPTQPKPSAIFAKLMSGKRHISSARPRCLPSHSARSGS